MIQIQVTGYTKPCTPNSGGVSRVFVFDPADFNWTQAAATAPGLGAYTAVALRAGATILTGSGFFEVGFDYLEGQYKAGHNAKGSSQKWAHTLTLEVPELCQNLASFFYGMQAALTCASLGFVIVQNNGHILIMGEKYVNAAELPAVFRVIMDGSEADSGKVFDDPNGGKLMVKGDYIRPLIEYTGGLATITALLGTPIF